MAVNDDAFAEVQGPYLASRRVSALSATTGTVDIDLNVSGLRTVTLSGNLTITTSNKGAGKSVTGKILCDGTGRTLTFPSWKWVCATPSSIAANKTGIFTVTFFGSAEADGVAAWAVEP